MAKNSIKKNHKTILLIVFVLICLAGLIYSLINIIHWKNDVDDNESVAETTKESITTDEKEDLIKIDFATLKEQNPDTIAYLKVNGTNIDYVVVKGNDNSYYLNHNFDKEYNIAGWIFADYHNRFDESDKNLIIYGHNIKDGSMFGTLEKVLGKEWYENENNHKVVLVTENGQYEYQVFATYAIIPEDYYINTIFKDNNEFDEFVKELKSRSVHNYNIEVTGDDKILTLSSCIGDGEKRVVLHAKLSKDN